MSNRATDLREQLSAILNALPGVFSTPQWGGRAYKVPAKAGSRSKPKLLAFVTLPDSQDAVQVSFKLAPDRAAAMVQRHEWIAPHPFRTLAPAGWITARVSTKRRLTTLANLLKESCLLYTSVERAAAAPTHSRPVDGRSDLIARHIDRVMRELRSEGWSPPSDDEFACWIFGTVTYLYPC
ncbi:MAG: MmcQ/YjbR family DNA-binding protein [Planctomycetes bacterium]|nr:MmcQ/YjbR family DNA-binding protein [Planctomycetota bacterium]